MYLDKRNVLIIAGIVLLLIMGVLGFSIIKSSGRTRNGSFDNKRLNTISLARDYMEKGEYQRALDLLDGLLIQDAGDLEARSLLDQIFGIMKPGDDANAYAGGTEQENQEKFIPSGSPEPLPGSPRTPKESLSEALPETSSLSSSGSSSGSGIWTPREEQGLPSEATRAQQAEEQRQKELEKKVDSLVLQSERALNSGDYGQAMDLVRQALLLDPSSAKASVLKRRTEQAQKDAESKAESLAREAREKAIGDLYEKGRAALDKKAWGEAESKGKEILVLDENDARAYTLAGQAQYQGNPDSPAARRKARDNLEKALHLDPSHPENLATLGDIALKEGNLAGGIDYYKKAVALDGNSPELYNLLGRMQYQGELYSDALASFKKCEALDPSFKGNYFAMGLTNQKLGRDSDALESMKLSIMYRSDHAASHWEAGKLSLARGQIPQAVSYFRKAVDLDSSQGKYYRSLGAAWYLVKDYDAAVSAYEKAAALEPGNGEIYQNIALIYLAKGDPSAALAASARAIGINPKNASYVYTMGEISEALGMESQAILSYKQAISIDRSYVKPHINLGGLYDKMGDYSQALSYLEEAKRLNPASSLAYNNLGNVFVHMEDYKAAVSNYEKALAIAPTDSGIQFNLAKAYLNAQQNEYAETILNQVCKLDPDNWDAWDKLAHVQFTLGKKREAANTIKTLLQNNPGYQGKAELEALMR